MQVWSCSSAVTQKHGSGFTGRDRAGLHGREWDQTGRQLRGAQSNLHLQVIASRQPEDTQRMWNVFWPPFSSLVRKCSSVAMTRLGNLIDVSGGRLQTRANVHEDWKSGIFFHLKRDIKSKLRKYEEDTVHYKNWMHVSMGSNDLLKVE